MSNNPRRKFSETFAIAIILFLAYSWGVDSLSPNNINSHSRQNNDNNDKLSTHTIDRRDLLLTGLSISAGGASSFHILPPQTASAATMTTTNGQSKPIAVLGASGRTGALCVTACLKRGIPVKALTRDGSWSLPVEEDNDGKELATDSLLTVEACDIKDSGSLTSALKGCSAVIYAASASKKGGNANAIDNIGVVDAGNVCLAENIARYVVISSTATTRPRSLGYVFTNVMGGIMDQKRLGEIGVQQAYKGGTSSSESDLSYTIVRPGGLNEPKKNEVLGASSLEITQGDVLSGIVSRADVAEVSVELALSRAPNLRNTALELYYTSSAVPVSGEFKSALTNGIVPRLHGATYNDLFAKIQPEIDYYS